ncbi:MAG: site-specific integrase [Chloracidobacterium sp.]|nr:site-specific integrase [Chloracidobacterium sp.]
MSTPISPNRPELDFTAHRLTLTDKERQLLATKRWDAKEKQQIAELFDPFKKAFVHYCVRNRQARYHHYAFSEALHFCGKLMLEFDCTYWGFEWERLRAWKSEMLEREKDRSKVWHWNQEDKWHLVASTLFFLGIIPYSEEIHKTFHRVLAEKWLGKDRARKISERFMTAALNVGYKDKVTLHKCVTSALLAMLVLAKKTDLSELTKVDIENWRNFTKRSKRVANASVIRIEKVLRAMGYLKDAPPSRFLPDPSRHYSWGRTAPQIQETFTRFLADFQTVRAAGTVQGYRIFLRRFGDWLGEYDPSVKSIADLRRTHVEAYKRAVKDMRCGDYTNVGQEFRTVNFGEPLSKSHQLRALSCVRSFCEQIDVLDYPERPSRKLWIRGDTLRIDQELPRTIPDQDWHRLGAVLESLTFEQVNAARFPPPFERMQAVLAVLFESGLRAGELCRLDTGCLLAAIDPQTGEQTHWLRVPVGKLRNDRMIPVRPQMVTAIDNWMKVRGQQPSFLDQRTNKPTDYLFAWRGLPFTTHMLNACITKLCGLAKTKQRYTSHWFRHTLATLWRRRGMRIESISRMLGHKNLTMTMRYAAVMPPLLRQEFETAFALIDEEHRATAQIRVLLSPEAHIAAQVEWRESLFVDLGLGWCGLTAYHPCETRLSCQSCPNLIPDKQSLPLLERQRANLVELRGLATEKLPSSRKEEVYRELTTAIDGMDRNIAYLNENERREAS